MGRASIVAMSRVVASRLAYAHPGGRTMERFLMVLHDGTVLALPPDESAREALIEPARATDVRLAKVL
jgi:hypothetical protein